jgi:hypothetical protein
MSRSSLDEEAKEALERCGRPRLTRDRRPALLLLGEEGAQVRHLHGAEVADPLTLQVIQGRRKRHARKPRTSSGQGAAPTHKSAGNRPVLPPNLPSSLLLWAAFRPPLERP